MRPGLTRLLERTVDLLGKFRQTYVHQVYGTRTVSHGALKLRKPGMMVWDYDNAADAVDDALEQVFGEVSSDRGSGRLTGELPDVIADALTRADLAVDRAVTSLREIHKAAGNAPMSAAAHRFERAIRNCDAVSDDLHALREMLKTAHTLRRFGQARRATYPAVAAAKLSPGRRWPPLAFSTESRPSSMTTPRRPRSPRAAT